MKRKYFIKRLLLFYSIVLIPILTVSSMMYVIIMQNMKATVNERAQSLLFVSKNSLELIMDVSSHLSALFNTNPELKASTAALLSRNTFDYSGLVTFKFMAYMTGYPTRVNPHISSVYLYINNKSGRFLSSDGRMSSIDNALDRGWYQSYLQNRDKDEMWVEQRVIRRSSVERDIYDTISIFHPISGGIIVANINQRFFNSMLSEYQNYNDELLIITTYDNQLLFSNEDKPPDLQLLSSLSGNSEEVTLDGRKYIANRQYSDRFHLQFWSLVPKDVLYEGTRTLLEITSLLLVASLGVTFLFTYFSTRKTFRRLSDIIDLFDKAEQGQPLGELRADRDEYSLLLNNVIRTFVNQSYLKLQLSERQYKQRVAELAALQLQINPHFLFNTLQTIDFEIVKSCGGTTTANSVLQHLCELLKYSLEGPALSTVRDEIIQAKKYCEIQKYRYPDKFFVFWDYPESIGECRMRRLIFQPLIENSLYHGIKPKDGPSLIKVQLHDRGERLEVKVIDNGIGMSETRLAEIRRQLLLDEDFGQSDHIGLINTSRRMVLSFGPQSRLQIRSRAGLGTTVSFTVPKYRLSALNPNQYERDE